MSLLEYLLARHLPFDECGAFKAAAVDTWERIRFSRTRPRLKVHETTVTQNLIYELNLLQSIVTGLRFVILESENEAANGDDLELCVPLRDGRWVTYAIQAKIIYHKGFSVTDRLRDGWYPQMQHQVGGSGENQIDVLISYAAVTRSVPLYLLYNYIDTYSLPLYQGFYGCSVVTAKYLKDHHSLPDGRLSAKVKFSDLHPEPARPWHCLVCDYSRLTVEELLDTIGMPGYSLRSRSFEDVTEERGWRFFNNDRAKQDLNQSFTFVSSKKGKEFDTPEFLPKFRIVLGQNDQEGTFS